MKYCFASMAFLLSSIVSGGQEVFFKSEQSFTPKQLDNIFASVNVSGSLVVFNAPD